MKFFLVLAFVAFASAASLNERDAQILSQTIDVGVDGSYQQAFQTSNGIAVQEQGVLKNAGRPEQEAEEVQGSAQWTAPDGTPITLQYVANELGYQPQGSHLPVAPPVPEAIVRALAWIAAHPQKEEPLRRF